MLKIAVLFVMSVFATAFSAGVASAADFPIKLKDKDRLKAGWFMESDLTVSNTGKITGTTVSMSLNLNGFTGAAVVYLEDKAGNVLWATSKSVGVSGAVLGGTKTSAPATWDVEFPKGLVSKIEKVDVVHIHAPNNRLPGTIKEFVDGSKPVIEFITEIRKATGK